MADPDAMFNEINEVAYVELWIKRAESSRLL